MKKSYQWAKSKSAYSSSLIGFFPEFVGPDYPNSEGCPIADMIALALKFSTGGVGDYWDDADRWLRNHFAEIQLTRTKAEHLCRISQSMEQTPLLYNATDDKVTERNIGAFAGWPTPNDWVRHIGIQHCCTGNAARTIYYAWENILHFF